MYYYEVSLLTPTSNFHPKVRVVLRPHSPSAFLLAGVRWFPRFRPHLSASFCLQCVSRKDTEAGLFPFPFLQSARHASSQQRDSVRCRFISLRAPWAERSPFVFCSFCLSSAPGAASTCLASLSPLPLASYLFTL